MHLFPFSFFDTSTSTNRNLVRITRIEYLYITETLSVSCQVTVLLFTPPHKALLHEPLPSLGRTHSPYRTLYWFDRSDWLQEDWLSIQSDYSPRSSANFTNSSPLFLELGAALHFEPRRLSHHGESYFTSIRTRNEWRRGL